MPLPDSDLMTVCIGGDQDGRRVIAGRNHGSFNGSESVYQLSPVTSVDHDEPRAFYVARGMPFHKWVLVAIERWEQGVICGRLYGPPTPIENVEEIKELAARFYGTHMRIKLLRLAGDVDSIAESNFRLTQMAQLRNSLGSLGARFVSDEDVFGDAVPVVKIIHSDFRVEELNYNSGRLWNERLSNGDY